MKRTLIALLSGVAMTGMVSMAHAAVDFDLFDADEDGFISQEEFTAGLEDAENFEGDEGFFGIPMRMMMAFSVWTRSGTRMSPISIHTT